MDDRLNTAKGDNVAKRSARPVSKPTEKQTLNLFNVTFKTDAQRDAWDAIKSSDVTFLIGAAGSGKSHLAMGYAIGEVLAGRKTKIVLTRPIVEAGEKLGFLPGDFDEKVAPYMLPLMDCLAKIAGDSKSERRAAVNHAIEVAPLAYMRGRTFDDAVLVFDEAQNATYGQIKLALSRIGKNCQVIVTGDPDQTDLDDSGLMDAVDALDGVAGISIVEFDTTDIVRHPVVGRILRAMQE